MKLWKRNVIMLVIIAVIAIVPLIIKHDAEFGGADGQAEEAITEIQPDYEPWAESLYEPPSGEIESLLFALQAALGAGVIGFGFGRLSAKHKEKK